MNSTDDQDLRRLRNGGHMFVRLVNKEPWMCQELLPNRILSASEHLCPHLPASWAFISSDDPDALRRSEAGSFGIAADRLTEVVLWLSDRLEASAMIEWPNVFLSLDLARQFAACFLSLDEEWNLIGLSIDPQYAEEIDHQLGSNRAGYWAAIDHRLGIPPGGEILGFEVLGYAGAGTAHSWICNGIEQTFYEATGIRPNPAGLLATSGESALCLALIASNPEWAEPVPWFPWMLTRYPI